ncbi:MAG: NAD(P)/FAD-dependent oxidoreductase [Terrimicrobiaceae bacterium]
MSQLLCVVGAGPAGLRAAEVAAESGVAVAVFDAMPSVGRKFLVAGRGGLNLTNTDSHFAEKYDAPGASPEIWRSLLADFEPDALRQWAARLGVETFAASSGRVYPKEMKSAPLLRRWVTRLRELGVQFHARHKWTGLNKSDAAAAGGVWQLEFQTPSGKMTIETKAAVFALGGGSWPKTGSDGSWQTVFETLGVLLHPLVPANCGWELAWPQQVIAESAGQPLKNVRGSVLQSSAYGELMITDYGLEGGVIYSLTPALRKSPTLHLDLKPAFSLEELVSRIPPGPRFHLHEAFERCRIQKSARPVMESHPDCTNWKTPLDFAHAVKSLPLALTGPRPIAEAISSAGGVRWSGLDANLMIQNLPGLFVAGEMLDWEAPTGGYLMQGCFCTGTRAGTAAAAFCRA